MPSLFPLPSWCTSPPCAHNISKAILRSEKGDIDISTRPFFTIGRSSSQSDVVVDHFTVSRKHAVLCFNSTDLIFYLIDLDTGHGTYVDDKKLSANIPIALGLQSKIRFGSCETVYTIRTDGKDEEPKEEKDTMISAAARKKAELAAAIASMNAPVVYINKKEAIQRDDNDEFEIDGIRDNMLTIVEEGTDAKDNEVEKAWGMPVSHEATISGHHKDVSAIALDRAGARFVTGGVDYCVRMYDFGGMNINHRPIRGMTPYDGHPVTGLSYSPTGAMFVVATTSSKFSVYDRDAAPVLNTIKGDPYILDVTHTKGHISAVNNVMWHPSDANTFMSCGRDSSIRIWDVNGEKSFEQLMNVSVIRAKDKRGVARISIGDCTYSPDGKSIAAVTEDGGIHMWQSKRVHGRPDCYVKDAHGGEISSIAWSPNGLLLATRAFDDTLKLWDVRKMTSGPLKSFGNLPNYLSSTACVFSPDSSLIVTGTNVRKTDDGGGRLVFGDTISGDDTPVKELGLLRGVSATSLVWHKDINQIFVGLSNGNVRILYDPLMSKKGYLNTVGRKIIKREDSYAAINEEAAAFTPAEERDFLLSRKRKRRGEEDTNADKDPRAPSLPTAGGGPITHKSTFTAHLMKTLSKDDSRMLDPREALLSFDKKEGTFVEGAYKNNRKILATKTLEEEMMDDKKAYKHGK